MRSVILFGALALAISCGGGCTSKEAAPKGPQKIEGRRGRTFSGKASYYGGRFHGRKTASGERFNKNAMTAAHRRLPFGTRVRVTNRENGKSCVVRINDRGPFGNRGRIIDLSEAAARKLGMIDAGVVRVKVEVIERPGGK